ncbi:hypothetical protein KEM52_000549 [Ascosphaera acerosa]|nr:hypothetical protein KEM52_000549 [Ascosphaera acerosa]
MHTPQSTIVPLPVPSQAVFTTNSPVKQSASAAAAPTACNGNAAAQQPLFTTFSSVPDASQTQPVMPTGQEKLQQHSHRQQQKQRKQHDEVQRPTGKPTTRTGGLRRKFTESMSLNDRPAKKQRESASKPSTSTTPSSAAPSAPSSASTPSPSIDVPAPEDLPKLEDDGLKPPYSYASLIGMAILRAPKRRLTLAQIYKWISDSFSYYAPGDAGWQNSIRHNLSLNKAFIKQERPKDDPGKGNYWVIQPGMEKQFLKEKPTRKNMVSGITISPQGSQRAQVGAAQQQQQQQQQSQRTPLPSCKSSASSSSSMSLTPSFEVLALAKPSAAPAAPRKQYHHTHQQQRHKAEADLSSDATLLVSASSSPLHEHGRVSVTLEDMDDLPRLVHDLHSSPPPPHLLRSSPPTFPLPIFRREATPPSPSGYAAAGPGSRSRPHSRSQSRRRSSLVINDSGYFSSLESSVPRPKPLGKVLASLECGRGPVAGSTAIKVKRGSAEEELARIRSSSHDRSSPVRQFPPHAAATTTTAADDADYSTFELASSPRRPSSGSMLPPPLTPAITFKRPVKPPPSASPNTNLRNHRQKISKLVASPLKKLGLDEEELPWSPAFNIQYDSAFSPRESQSAAVPYEMFDVFPASASLESPLRGHALSVHRSPSLRRSPRRSFSFDSPLADVARRRLSVSVKQQPQQQQPPQQHLSAVRERSGSLRRHFTLPFAAAGEEVTTARGDVTGTPPRHYDWLGINLFSNADSTDSSRAAATAGASTDADACADGAGVDLAKGFVKIGDGTSNGSGGGFASSACARVPRTSWKRSSSDAAVAMSSATPFSTAHTEK